MKLTVILSGICLSMLLLTGCGGDGLTPISGTVTLDGQPIQNGRIAFTPKGGSEGTMAGATIKDGKYEARVSLGKMGVAVRAQKMVPIKNPDAHQKDVGITEQPESIIPAKYNDKSELTADIVEGKSEYSFNLTTK